MWTPAEFHNLHTHSFRCKHAIGDVADYADLLCQKGGKVLGMACHNPFPDNRWEGERMSWAELDGYLSAIDQASDKYPELTIYKGLECEYAPEMFNLYQEEFLGVRGLDYLIGAAHYFPHQGEWLSSFHHLTEAPALIAYVKGLQSLMESGLFLFIAHPDLFGCGYEKWNEDLQQAAVEICEISRQTGVPLELNCSGYRKFWRGHGEVRPFPYPWEEFWQVAAQQGVEVVLSADAHDPKEYFYSLERALDLAWQLDLRLKSPWNLPKERQKAP